MSASDMWSDMAEAELYSNDAPLPERDGCVDCSPFVTRKRRTEASSDGRQRCELHQAIFAGVTTNTIQDRKRRRGAVHLVPGSE